MDALIFLPILIIILLALSIVIIPQQRMGVVERLGKFNRILGPGLHFRIPILERIAGKESIRIRTRTTIHQTPRGLSAPGVSQRNDSSRDR